MTEKVVLDTNVFISALFWKGPPHAVFRHSVSGNLRNSVSSAILKEIEERLLNKFHVPQEKVQEFLEVIVYNSEVVYPKTKARVTLRDPKDNKILDCALEAKASFIITGDKDILDIQKYRGIIMISPREFVKEYIHKK